MGFFAKKEANASRRQVNRPRPSVSSEAQAASLRVKARRRLAGAIALVLAAVIVLPMLLDGDPQPIPAGIQITVPKQDLPFSPVLGPIAETDLTPGQSTQTASPESLVPTPPVLATATEPPKKAEQPASTGKPAAAPSAPSAPSAAQASATPPASTTRELTARTEEGARALALLEGRQPSSATGAASRAGFVVQLASYGALSDANARRDKLRSEGVTNAFIEDVIVNDKPAFRLRVGPFDSREAAQAAQTRLRTLGYNDGFIATQ
jgi:DedD protein